MIAAGAVVTTDIPDYALVAVPARVIGRVDEQGNITHKFKQQKEKKNERTVVEQD